MGDPVAKFDKSAPELWAGMWEQHVPTFIQVSPVLYFDSVQAGLGWRRGRLVNDRGQMARLSSHKWLDIADPRQLGRAQGQSTG